MDYAEGTYPGDAPLYSRTQSATLLLGLMGVAQAGVVVAAAVSGEYAVLALLAFFIPVELLFFRLTVTVDRRYVRAVFGVGLIRKRVPVGSIVSAHHMRNSPLMGWGIRYCGRRCWLYNVSGLDAVEMQLVDGRRVRFGTGDPQGLNAAIQSVLGRA